MEIDEKFETQEIQESEDKICEQALGNSIKPTENLQTAVLNLAKNVELPSFQDDNLPFEELKSFDFLDVADFEQFPELENYETWCGIPSEFEEILKQDELKLNDMLFGNHPDEESSDEEDNDGIYQKNLGKEYRKFIRGIISKNVEEI